MTPMNVKRVGNRYDTSMDDRNDSYVSSLRIWREGGGFMTYFYSLLLHSFT